MLRQSVESSDLKSVGYDNETQTLEIEFNSGPVYEYNNVPASIYEGLINAHSLGLYFNQNIKDQYHFSKISS